MSGFHRQHIFSWRPRALAQLVLTGILALLVAMPAAAQQAGGPVLPPIVGTAHGQTRAIAVRSANPRLLEQARFLFGLHGAYRIEAQGRPDFVFSFEPAGERAVELIIASAGVELLRETHQGRDAAEALTRAADQAVRRTTGLPGFFGGMIAFVSDRSGSREIHTSDLLFSRTRQLTTDRVECLLPNLSPDGRTLLYTSYHRNGFPDIFAVDLATGRRTLFAGYRGTNTGATFSPDGQSVAMILSSAGNAELFIADRSGRQLRRLTNNDSLEADPVWAPDGKRLALTSDRTGRPQIYLIDAQGRDFTRVPTNISRHCAEPAWNPRNPDQLAFTAATSGTFQTALYSFRTGQSRFITGGAADTVHPTWLSDGRHLICTERTSTYHRLVVLDSETGRRSRLTPAELRNTEMASFVYPEQP
jgi:TolB protein